MSKDISASAARSTGDDLTPPALEYDDEAMWGVRSSYVAGRACDGSSCGAPAVKIGLLVCWPLALAIEKAW